MVGNENAHAVAIIPPIEPAETAQAIDVVVIFVHNFEHSNIIKTSVGAIQGPIGVAKAT